MTQRTKVFVPHDSLVWVTANILNEIDPMTVEVEVTDEEYLSNPRLPSTKKASLKGTKLKSFPLQNEISESGIDDMTKLNFLHEASILDNLRRRFFVNKPYTYTGDICIAVNPYQWLDIYSEESRDRYLHQSRLDLPPHVYATSASAYKGLKDLNKNQSILVSGESGAGKTETVKILMSHVAQIAGKAGDTTIEKVLKANPLLESFGNAKTGRNDNSSRFGKFTQLQFDQQSRLVGSRCVTYLLEKTRVISQGDLNERNYHIFHEVFAAPDMIKQSLSLNGKTCKDFFYTSQGDTATDTIEHVPDSERFQSTLRTLELIGVNRKTRVQILHIIAGIVHMGQISFVGDADTSRIDPAVSETTISTCCGMLGLVPQAFKERIVVRNVDAAGEALLVELSKEQAIDGRDALAKEIYNRLFSWLVRVINESTAPSTEDAKCNRIIGLLDIFGFEFFKVNRFEQLCINYTNEKLQQKFTSDVLQHVQEEYRQEGLDWTNIEYKDNNDVLDLLEGKLGFITLLNEECLMPKGSNSNFLNKIKTTFKENPLFSLSVHISKDEFCIHHYAAKVSYNVNGFLERNKDTLAPEMRQLMLTSSNELVAQIFAPYSVGAATEEDSLGSSGSGSTRERTTRHRSQSFMMADTVFTKFKSQLSSLMDSISCTNVNYVRCIKPNNNKSKNEYNRPMVVEQLRCSGIIEAVKVSRAAYPYRVPHKEFIGRFRCLRSTKWWRTEDKKSTIPEANKARNLMKIQCQMLLTSYSSQFNALTVTKAGGTRASIASGGGRAKLPFEMGKTKVFFSEGVLELFERLRTQALHTQCVIIQRRWKTRQARKAFLKKRQCAVLVQATVRCRSLSRRYKLLLAGAKRIQTVFRRYSAMKLLVRLREFFRATQIQSHYRMRRLRRQYMTAKQAVIVLGSIAKMMTQRRKYIKMRNQAREDALLINQIRIVKGHLDQEKAKYKGELERRIKVEEDLRQQQRQMDQLVQTHRVKVLELADEKAVLKHTLDGERLSKVAAVAAANEETRLATVEMERQLKQQREEHDRQMQEQQVMLKLQGDQQASELAWKVGAGTAAGAAAVSLMIYGIAILMSKRSSNR